MMLTKESKVPDLVLRPRQTIKNSYSEVKHDYRKHALPMTTVEQRKKIRQFQTGERSEFLLHLQYWSATIGIFLMLFWAVYYPYIGSQYVGFTGMVELYQSIPNPFSSEAWTTFHVATIHPELANLPYKAMHFVLAPVFALCMSVFFWLFRIHCKKWINLLERFHRYAE